MPEIPPGWTPRKLAAHLGISDRAMRRAMAGVFPLPEAATAWLAYLAEPMAGHPPTPELVQDRLAAQPLPDGWGTGDLPLTTRASAPRLRQTPPEASAG